MKVFLRPNFNRQQGLAGTQAVLAKLLELGIEPLLSDIDAEVVGDVSGCVIAPVEELMPQCDILMPIGGDGTVLHETKNAVRYEKPLMGINAGRIGFLTQLELGELEHLKRLKEQNFTVSPRMLLETILEKNSEQRTYYALNDIVLRRHTNDASILDLSVLRKGKLILRQRADGVIFATPTGSTAYSLSAGGPVVDPEIEAILLTSIAPHSTFRCGMVLDSRDSYEAKEDHDHDQWGFSVLVDGQFFGSVERGEKVIIRKSPQQVQLVDLGVRDFYRNLNSKLVTI